MTAINAEIDEPAAALERDDPACFAGREELLADLEAALGPEARAPDRRPKMLAIFGLEGFAELADRYGREESRRMVADLAGRLRQSVGSTGSWYRPRADELAFLCDADEPALEPSLHRAVAALSDPTHPLTAAFGSVVVPREAFEPIGALRLADERLSAAQPGRLPRDRRQQDRLGGREERRLHAVAPVAASAASPPPAEPLARIHLELLEASTAAIRMRRVDRLLDLAATLSTIADAVRITHEGGGLQGQPRDPARIPVLLRELGLKLAASQTLGGPEIPEAAKLAGEVAPAASGMGTRVLTALDEIRLALASC